MLSAVNSNIGKAAVKQNISLLQISAFLDELSSFCKDRIAEDYKKYGLELASFYFQSINIPEEDPSYIKLKQIKEKAAELTVVGRDIYQLDKSMDVLKTAAGNEGMAGLMMQTGMGAGMGMMMGAQIGHQAGHMITQLNPSGGPPPLAIQFGFYLGLNGKQSGPHSFDQLKQMVKTGDFTPNHLVWRSGMSAWQPASAVTDLTEILILPAPSMPSATPPPL